MKQITLIFWLTENIFLPHIRELVINKGFHRHMNIPYRKTKITIQRIKPLYSFCSTSNESEEMRKTMICLFSLKNNRVSNFVPHQKKISFLQGLLFNVHFKCLNIRCIISFHYYILISSPACQCKLRFLKSYKAYLFLKFLQIFIPKIRRLWKQTSEKRDQPIFQIK